MSKASPFPKDVLLQRLKHEMKDLVENVKHDVFISVGGGKWIHIDMEAIEGLSDLPIWLYVRMKDIPGPVQIKGGGVRHRYNHELMIKITARYPFEKPVVRWQSKIFHPNIMPPEEGGLVCTKLLDNWGFRSTLVEFITGLELLLIHPNPKNPYGTETCTLAAQYFNTHKYTPPMILKEEKKRPEIRS